MEKPGKGRMGEGQIRHKGLGRDSVYQIFLLSDLFYSEMTMCSVLITLFSSITVVKWNKTKQNKPNPNEIT